MRLMVLGWTRIKHAASSQVSGRSISIVWIFSSKLLGETSVTWVGTADVFILNSLIEWKMFGNGT